jgi:hypothetical protein
MPHTAFLLMAASWAASGYWLTAAAPAEAAMPPVGNPPAKPEEPVEVGWHDVAAVDRLGLEVGYRLVPLVDKHQDGELLRRIRGIRKKIAQDLGFPGARRAYPRQPATEAERLPHHPERRGRGGGRGGGRQVPGHQSRVACSAA